MEGSFKSLKGTFVGLKWSGFIQIKEKGKYNFVLERTVPLSTRGLPYSQSRVKLLFLPITPSVGRPMSQQMQLDPDFQAFELFTYSRGMQNYYSQHQLRLKIRSENSPLPITLDANTVFHTPTPTPSSTPTLKPR